MNIVKYKHALGEKNNEEINKVLIMTSGNQCSFIFKSELSFLIQFKAECLLKKEKIRSVYKIYITKHFFIRERNVAKTLSEMFPINVE